MDLLQEFWYCVAPQSEIPLYRGESLDDSVVSSLLEFLRCCREGLRPPFSASLQRILLDNPQFIHNIRLLLGISDKRFYLDMTYLAHVAVTADGRRLVPEGRETLVKHSTAWFVGRLTRPDRAEWARLIASYFASNGLEHILNAFLSLSEEQVREIFNNLIAPKEIQQKQAKYRGHGAEQVAARSFFEAGANIYPPNKHLTPMAERDPNVDLSTMRLVSHEAVSAGIHSFDLVILDGMGRIRALLQSLIHTSDPGQYGVNKSDETVAIKQQILRYNTAHPEQQVYLIGNVDGVGFSENPSGTIAKMLGVFDCFVQMNTMFKAALYLQQVGLTSGVRYVLLDSDYFSPQAAAHFERTYILPAGAQLVSAVPGDAARTVRAGRALLIY